MLDRGKKSFTVGAQLQSVKGSSVREIQIHMVPFLSSRDPQDSSSPELEIGKETTESFITDAMSIKSNGPISSTTPEQSLICFPFASSIPSCHHIHLDGVKRAHQQNGWIDLGKWYLYPFGSMKVVSLEISTPESVHSLIARRWDEQDQMMTQEGNLVYSSSVIPKNKLQL